MPVIKPFCGDAHQPFILRRTSLRGYRRQWSFSLAGATAQRLRRLIQNLQTGLANAYG